MGVSMGCARWEGPMLSWRTAWIQLLNPRSMARVGFNDLCQIEGRGEACKGAWVPLTDTRQFVTQSNVV